MESVCVFLGSSQGNDPRFVEAAANLGAAVAARGLHLVYGGAGRGLMAALADAALAAGGEVTGVMPRQLFERETRHKGLTREIVVESMHERKARMAELADGFLALPGGFGTLEELFEVVTWAQLGYHEKPCGLLEVAGYFRPLLTFLDRMVAQGFLRPEHRKLLMAATVPDDILDAMARYRPAHVPKWIGKKSEL